MIASDNSGRGLNQPHPTLPTEGPTRGGARPSENSNEASPRVTLPTEHQEFVFADPIAFRYLEDDPSAKVVKRRCKLHGYDIYIVEQWACSRTDPTFVIATFTGDLTHSIFVDVLSVPIDKKKWSPRLVVYFRAIADYHAKEKETSLGTLMVTNLSGFPSSLTVIPVPEGDIRRYKDDFIVNENLKRLGCAGRAGLVLQSPQPSTIAKFHHLFRTNENVPLKDAVMELVKLCQVALLLYGKLGSAYADGLLCDITERSINEWWSEIGTYIFNVEPNDGILGPSTVSGLIGLVMGAHNRLKLAGTMVGKDVFDVNSTKRAIGDFQKTQKLERTRRLDRQTLIKLHQSTAKAASGDGWTVPKAVKSTMAELSGKGGEMVMGIVGGRDKAGVADVETLDLERLAQLVTGVKARWLWQGKQAKPTESDPFAPFGSSVNDKIFRADDQGNYMWTGKHRDSAWSDSTAQKRERAEDSENRKGFGRLKEAVGLPSLRTHQSKYSKEINEARGPRDPDMTDKATFDSREMPMERRSVELQMSDPSAPAQDAPDSTLLSPFQSSVDLRRMQSVLQDENAVSRTPSKEQSVKADVSAGNSDPRAKSRPQLPAAASVEALVKVSSQVFPGNLPVARGLQRSQSSLDVVNLNPDNPRMNRVPRSLSFSTLEGVILDWGEINLETDGELSGNQIWHQRLAEEQTHALFVQRKSDRLSYLERVSAPFTETYVQEIDDLEQLSQEHQKELNSLYYTHLEDYQTQKATAIDIIGDERHQLGESLHKVEMLGSKLDYELDALKSRAEEVEDGVTEFERAVLLIETRVDELFEEDKPNEAWSTMIARFFGLAEGGHG